MNTHILSSGNTTEAGAGMAAPDRDWWRGAVIYQIYPRSFQDTNGDGIGDLAGITARLGHIAGLGADAIWISPFFTSPMKDFGYDVSDYCNVDGIFGTLDDFDALIAEAHRLNIKVMIDLVLSHTSDVHPWFVESRSSRSNAKADWYVWADPSPDGTPPNNWMSIFGGSAWQWDTRRLQYYMHNFLTSQPDLNFHNPEVQDALLDVTRFWLKRGVDGFRLDTINFYFHDRQLRNNPALPPSERNAQTAPAVNPYNHQNHIYDKSQPENLEFLRRFRAVLDEFPAIAAVGEVGDSQRGLEIAGQYTSDGDKVHMCYAFEFLAPEPLTPAFVRETQEKLARVAPEGWACWAFSNHDVTRHITRWGHGVEATDAHAKLLAALLMSLRGSVCIYQGEELALPRSRSRLRGSSGSLRHPVLAGLQGPRRLPDADGLGTEFHRMAASRPPSHGCRCPLPISAARSMSRAPIRHRPWRSTAPSWLSVNAIRRWPRARSSSWPPTAPCWHSPARSATRRCSACST